MSNLETVHIKMKLSSDWFRLPPHVKIFLNDDLVDDIELSEKTAEGDSREIIFQADLGDGDHVIKIQYLGKESPDTRVDEQGNILEDHLVHIDSVEIDEIDLGYLSRTASTYYPDRELHPEASESMPETVDLGYNGTWELKFQVPTYIWFLENL